MPIHAKRSGSWDQLPSGDLHVKVNGSWRIVKKGYAKVNGTWRTVHLGSDPKTIKVRPNSGSTWPTRFARGTSWGNSSNGPWISPDDGETLAMGRYFTGANTQRYYGIIRWENILAAELAERPVVKSATLRLTRHSSTHGLSVPTGTIHVSRYNGSSTTTNPNCADVTFANRAQASINNLGFNETINIDLNSNGNMQTLVEHAADNKHFAITNVNSGLCDSGASLDSSYMFFYGLGVNLVRQPLLTVELDYI